MVAFAFIAFVLTVLMWIEVTWTCLRCGYRNEGNIVQFVTAALCCPQCKGKGTDHETDTL